MRSAAPNDCCIVAMMLVLALFSLKHPWEQGAVPFHTIERTAVSLIDFSVATRESRMTKLQSGEPQDDFGAARRCEAGDCNALLSRYNPARTCSVHRGWHEQPTPRRRR